MFPSVTLRPAARQDVADLLKWLQDPEVSGSWRGRAPDGTPLHIGYNPADLLKADDDAWRQMFDDENRKIFAIYTADGQHIGEGQLAIEWPLLEAQLFLLVGRKDLWHHHYGTMAMVRLLDEAFHDYGLHRVWVDVPEYNQHGRRLCAHVGFVLEGHLRKTHRLGDQWHDSFAMGLLADEYARRRARLLGTPAPASR